jgi:hypothetical protein
MDIIFSPFVFYPIMTVLVIIMIIIMCCFFYYSYTIFAIIFSSGPQQPEVSDPEISEPIQYQPVAPQSDNIKRRLDSI